MLFALKLLGVLKWIRALAAKAFALAMRFPWQTALIAALCWGVWERHGKVSEIAAHKADTARCRVNAEEVARKSQEALRLAQIAAQAVSEESKHAHDIRTPLFAAAAADYKRTHRVRVPAESSATPAGNPDPGAPVEAPADAELVGITGDNFDRCSASAQYALEAWEFLDGLQAKGLALPDPAFGGK